MIRPTLVALVFVLTGSVAWCEDYVLVMPENGIATGTCVKTRKACDMARASAARGELPGIARGTPSRCRTMPQGCFSGESLVIRGFNDR